MRRAAALVLLLTAIAVPRAASADTLTFQPPVANMDNLDHHYIYTWRIDGVTQMGNLMAANANHVVTSVRLYFENISNWDNTANRLFVHLLDDAKHGSNYLRAQTSVNRRLYQNGDTTGQPVIDIDDDFSNSQSYGNDAWMQSDKRSALQKETKSFTTAAEAYTYSFTEAQIASLVDYIRNGNDFALALDPDCHFDNDYVKLFIDFSAAQQVVPEPASMWLMGTGLAGLIARRNRRRRRSAAWLEVGPSSREL